MTEQDFENLTNLYLDNEIGRQDLRILKAAIKENLVFRRRFERSCKLHQAARQALATKTAKTGIDQQPVAHAKVEEPRRHRHGRHGHASAMPIATRQEQQRKAQLNATVSTLSERQQSQGAAATIRLDSLGKTTRGKSGSSSMGRRSLRDELPLGTWIKMSLTACVGVVLLYFTWGYLNAVSDYEPDGNTLSLRSARGGNLPELVQPGAPTIAHFTSTPQLASEVPPVAADVVAQTIQDSTLPAIPSLPVVNLPPASVEPGTVPAPGTGNLSEQFNQDPLGKIDFSPEAAQAPLSLPTTPPPAQGPGAP